MSTQIDTTVPVSDDEQARVTAPFLRLAQSEGYGSIELKTNTDDATAMVEIAVTSAAGNEISAIMSSDAAEKFAVSMLRKAATVADMNGQGRVDV